MPFDRTPKLKVPLTFVGKGFATVEQDSAQEIIQCVEAIVRTPLGSREHEPEFGIPDQTFAKDPDTIGVAIDRWEPRAEDTIIDEDLDESVSRITIATDLRGDRTDG